MSTLTVTSSDHLEIGKLYRVVGAEKEFLGVVYSVRPAYEPVFKIGDEVVAFGKYEGTILQVTTWGDVDGNDYNAEPAYLVELMAAGEAIESDWLAEDVLAAR